MGDLVEMFGSDVVPAPFRTPENASPSNPPDPVASEIPSEQTTPMSSLANLVMTRFRENAVHRRDSGQDARLSYCIRAQTCSFSQEQMDRLSKAFPREVAERMFVPVTSTKIRAARAMLVDLCNQGGEPLFHIEPSPHPEVPMETEMKAVESVMSEVKQAFSMIERNGSSVPPEEAVAVAARLKEMVSEVTVRRADDMENFRESHARERCRRMEKKVWDHMEEGGFNDAFYEAVSDCCTYGTGGILGPVRRVVPDNEIVEDRRKRTVSYRRAYRSKLVYTPVSPQDMYPAPDARNVEDGPLCIRERITAASLHGYAESVKPGEPEGDGWIGSAVHDLLVRHPNGGVKLNFETFSPERRYCERNGFDESADCTFEAVHAFLPVKGQEFIAMGIFRNRRGERIDSSKYYRGEVIVIDNRVVYCRIYDDVLGVPFSKCTFYQLPGSWWGESVADKLGATQTILNNCFKAMLNNMASAAGAVYWINDVQRLANKSPDALKIKAGKAFPFNSSMVGNTGAPMGAISVPSVASELLSVWKTMQTQADMDSGIPSYTEGQSAGSSGALRTAQGLAMFTEASTRGMKMVMTSIDRQMISRVAKLTANYELLYGDDQSLKGDLCIRSVGLIGKILKAQRDQARLQIFQLVTNNRFLMSVIGVKGVLELFRPSLNDVDVNPDDVLPSRSRMEDMETIEEIRQWMQATEPSARAESGEGAGGGAPGVAAVETPSVPGGVSERRAVA